MRKFDFYEFMGYIAPGMLLLVGISIVWPKAHEAMKLTDLSIAGFGVGIVVAYGAGQLLQAVGNGIETLWWFPWGGQPTDWLRIRKHTLIAPAQLERVQTKVQIMLGKEGLVLQPSLERREWVAIRKEVYAAVASAGLAKRIDIFNGNYGLCRGIAAGLVVVLAWGLTVGSAAWQVYVGLAVLFVLAIYRMHRFGVHYAREIFVQFLRVPEEGGGKQ